MGSHTSKVTEVLPGSESIADRVLETPMKEVVPSCRSLDDLKKGLEVHSPASPSSPRKKRSFVKNKLTAKLFSENKLTPSPPASPKLNRFKDGKAYERQMSISNFQTTDQVLGEGAFAKVRLATNIATGTRVAVKTFVKSPRMGSQQLADLAMIRKEKDIMVTRLRERHPNIVQFYTWAEDETNFCIYMQYIEGGDMFSWLCDRKQAAEDICKNIFVQMLDALEFCHLRGICHRDVKLENFMLETVRPKSPTKVDRGNVFYKPILIDFGFATPIPPDGLYRNFPGSPSYACPSILRGVPYDGISADVYALGVTLYTMIYGKYPFYDEDNVEFYRQICEDQPSYLRYQIHLEFFPSLSSEVIDLMQAMLEKKNERRITIAGIRNHPWLKNYPQGPNPPPRIMPKSVFEEEVHTPQGLKGLITPSRKKHQKFSKKGRTQTSPVPPLKGSKCKKWINALTKNLSPRKERHT